MNACRGASAIGRWRGWWIALALFACVGPAAAQSRFGTASSTTPPKPRPTGRISVYQGTWTDTPTDGESVTSNELITQLTFNAPETEEDGVDYGVNFRHAGMNNGRRPNRVSLYEGWAGARLASGHARVRGGHLWLNDLGALGSLAGGVFEWRGAPGSEKQGIGRFRVGGFAGLEPKVFDTGYYDGVKKYGVYGALDGDYGRRHSVGYVQVKDRSITERSVVSTMNFIPVKRGFFLYQGAEYDLVQPAGQARKGLNYFYTNARGNIGSKLQLQGTYNRGRSVDTRGLADDVLNGRPISQTTAQGLAYESIGGRVTVTPISRVSLYASRSQDKSNREDKPSNRLTIGGNAMNVGGSGLDVSATITRNERLGTTYRSDYVSLGRQIGRHVYVNGDYTNSLSIIQFSRSDGLLIIDRPTTRRFSATSSINVGPSTMLQLTVDRVWDTNYKEFRLLTGIAYRFR